MDNGVALLDSEGNIQWANPAFYQLVVFSHPEICLETWNTILDGRICKEEILSSAKDGSPYIIEITITPIKDKQGEINSFIIIHNDITNCKQKGEILARYRFISEITSDIILLVDTNGIIMEANEAAVKAYGYSKEELLSLSLYDLCGPENYWSVEKNLKKAVMGGTLFEIVQYRKDQTYFWAEINSVGTVIGNQIMIASIVRDITERSKVQQQMLKANRKIAQAKRLSSLAVITAGIAHEINQPLNSIKVTADSILYWARKDEAFSREEVLESISNISKQCLRIDQIIKKNRIFLRGQNSLDLIPCNLNQGIEEVFEILGTCFISKGIKIEKRLQENLPLILALPTRLEEIIINLLSNSLDSLSSVEQKGKKITITTRMEYDVVLEISDNGLGIDDELKEIIFEPFFTTRTLKENLGLGLTIVQFLVNSCHGKIEVRNNEQGGATFRVMFPTYEE